MVEQHVVYSESQQRRIFGLLQPEKKQKGMYTNKIDGFPTLHCTFALLSLSTQDRSKLYFYAYTTVYATDMYRLYKKSDPLLLQTKILRCFLIENGT